MTRRELINHKSEWTFATIFDNGIVKQIGKGYFYHPVVNFNGGNIKWFDDSKLIIKKGGKE